MHCHKCDKFMRSDAPHQTLEIFEDEEFPLCSTCAAEFKKLLKKAKTQKQKEKLIKDYLKKLSDS